MFLSHLPFLSSFLIFLQCVVSVLTAELTRGAGFVENTKILIWKI